MLIKDVARVEDGGTPADADPCRSTARTPSTSNVLRIPGGNTIEIVDAVEEGRRGSQGPAPRHEGQGLLRSVDLRADAPITGSRRRSSRRSSSSRIVILLFLQSVRGTLIVSVAIPLSFAITLIVLYATGQTLNAFTLGGLTLAMGRLVDDAVVVLESIHRHQRMGMTPARPRCRGPMPSRCPCSRRR